MSEYTEEWLTGYQQRIQKQAERAIGTQKVTQNIVPPTPKGDNALQGLKLDSTQKKSLVIVLPFKLPTWNALLAMGVWQRKKERDRIHAAVQLACIASVKG